MSDNITPETGVLEIKNQDNELTESEELIVWELCKDAYGNSDEPEAIFFHNKLIYYNEHFAALFKINPNIKLVSPVEINELVKRTNPQNQRENSNTSYVRNESSTIKKYSHPRQFRLPNRTITADYCRFVDITQFDLEKNRLQFLALHDTTTPELYNNQFFKLTLKDFCDNKDKEFVFSC